MGLICQWIRAHEGSGMSKYYFEKYERSSVYFNLKETSLKRRNKYEDRWQVGYYHSGCRAWDLYVGPLDYEANVLSTELSYQMTH